MRGFKIGKFTIDLGAANFERQASRWTPEPVKCPGFIVWISGRPFPIKQPITQITALSVEDIPIIDAYCMFKEMGYRVEYRKR